MDQEVKLPLSKIIDEAYANMKQATEWLHNANVAYVMKKRDLEQAVQQAIAQGQIVGKNENERVGQALILFAPDYEEAKRLEEEYSKANLNHRMASLEVEHLHMLLQLADIQTRNV